MIGFLISKTLILDREINSIILRKIVIASVGLLVLGILLNQVYPINKPLWTGSYVFYTSGIIGLFLVFLIWLIDINKLTKWSFPFNVFGLNPLLSFVFSILLVKIFLYIFKFENGNLYSLTYKNIFQPIFGNFFGSFVFALGFTSISWFFSFLLYGKGKVVKL